MPRNSSGTYTKPANTTAITGELVEAAPYNELADDIAQALTATLPRDGSAAMTANLPMGGFKVTNVADGVAATDGATKSQVDAVSAGFMEAGSIMLFQQSSAPAGWTKLTTHNDKILRLVNGTASFGGSTPFSSVLTARTIGLNNLPSHSHSNGSYALSSNAISGGSNIVSNTSRNTTTIDSDGGKTCVQTIDDIENADLTVNNTAVGGTSGSTGSSTAIDFAVQYVDVIMASKN